MDIDGRVREPGESECPVAGRHGPCVDRYGLRAIQEILAPGEVCCKPAPRLDHGSRYRLVKSVPDNPPKNLTSVQDQPN